MSPAIRWSLYAAIVVATTAHQLLSMRYGWWPVGAATAVVAAVLIAVAVTLRGRDQKAPRGGSNAR